MKLCAVDEPLGTLVYQRSARSMAMSGSKPERCWSTTTSCENRRPEAGAVRVAVGAVDRDVRLEPGALLVDDDLVREPQAGGRGLDGGRRSRRSSGVRADDDGAGRDHAGTGEGEKGGGTGHGSSAARLGSSHRLTTVNAKGYGGAAAIPV